MSEIAEEFEHNGKTVRLMYDPEPERANPRDADNLGIMLANGHRRYTLGDEPFMKGKHGEYDDAARALAHYASERKIHLFPRWCKINLGSTVVLPLGLIDHSGISISAGANLLDGGGINTRTHHYFDPGGWADSVGETATRQPSSAAVAKQTDVPPRVTVAPPSFLPAVWLAMVKAGVHCAASASAS